MAPRRKETPLELCDKATVLGNTIAIRMLEYLSTVKHHVQGFGDLANEFLEVCRILWAIESGLGDANHKQHPSFPADMLTELEKHFRQVHDDFIVLNQLVTRFLDNDKKHGFARVAKGFKMMFADSDVNKMRMSLEKTRETLKMSALVFRWSLGGDEVDATIGIGYTGLAAALDRLNGVNRTASRNTLQTAAAAAAAAPPSRPAVTPQRPSSDMSPRPHRFDQGPELPPALPPLAILDRHSTQSQDFMGNRLNSTATTDDHHDLNGLSDRAPSRSLRAGSGSLRSSKGPAHSLVREITRSNASSPTRTGSRGKSMVNLDSASTHTAETEMLLEDLLSEADLNDKLSHQVTRVKADPATVPRWTPRYNTGGNDPQLKVALAQAVQKKNHAIIEQLLDRGVAPDSIEEVSLLLEAVINRDAEAIRLLLLFGAEPNTYDTHDVTPLFQATHMGFLEGAKMLVKYGADPNLAAGPENDTPLALAAVEGNLDLVHLFLTYGGDPGRIMANNNTVLVRAINRKTPRQVIELLLNYGSDPNGKNGEGTSPMSHAVIVQRLDIAQLLLDRGADPNLPGPKHPLWPSCYKPLFLKLLLSRGADFTMAPGIMEFATSINNVESVRTLLSAGVDPNSKKDGVYTPLCSAIRDDRAEIVSLLLANGADPNLPASEYPCFKCVTHHRTQFLPQIIEAGGDPNEPKGIIEKAVAHDNMGALIYLVDHGVDVNTKSPEGYTPLTTAIREDRADMVDLLLGRGADPGIRGQDWPLCMAVKRPQILKKLLPAVSNPKSCKGVVEMAVCADQLESIKLLLGAGFSVEDKNGGVFSPLTSAIREGHKHIVKYLIDEAGANVNAPGEHLPIIKAIRRMRNNDTEVLELLLARGADINLMYRGWNAVLQAVENGDAHVLKVLVEKGNGVDMEQQDENGRTVMDIVNERGWDEAVTILGGGRR
ncbi:Ankyrin repeat and KH domain-containing protein 1 [Cytospora mali]|uniref:Ankyrin repeat and KH domain-containing protein 1 n=1 Tax=Cytospora mali TaxID=578113 RepID=A0A194VZF0_CYTMA|nr:Ankyrin repeat and KH domain-containing protein 1 [Valsa mali]